MAGNTRKTQAKNNVVTLSEEQLVGLADIVSTKIEEKLSARDQIVDKKLDDLQDATELLKEKTDDLEQRNRLENLRIFGIPEKKEENTNMLVLDVAKQLNIKLDLYDISRSHRVGKRNGDKPRAIIVKFVSYANRQEMFMAKKQLKGKGITIREDLTRQRQAILIKASAHFDEVWTQNGVVLIKYEDKYHRVQTMRKLEALMESLNIAE